MKETSLLQDQTASASHHAICNFKSLLEEGYYTHADAIPTLLILPIRVPSSAVATSTSPSPELSPFPTLRLSNAPSRSNKASIWEDVSSFEQYEPLPTKATALKLNDDATKVITVGLDLNWFGDKFTEVCILSNGQINMGETCDSSHQVKPIGSYDGARIVLVQQNLHPREGEAV